MHDNRNFDTGSVPDRSDGRVLLWKGWMKMEELKKCPFCDGEARIKMERKDNVSWTIWCECKKCHAKAEGYCPSMQNADNALKSINTCKINAIEAWNRRVEE